MPCVYLLGYGLANTSPSIHNALHVLAWRLAFLYLMPRMYLLGYGLADASPSILNASHVLAWQRIGRCLSFLLDASHVLAWLCLG